MTEYKPVCSTCNDTHVMALRDREVMCTHCPVPCDRCRHRLEAYCRATPCPCDCHDEAAFGPYADRLRSAGPCADEKPVRTWEDVTVREIRAHFPVGSVWVGRGPTDLYYEVLGQRVEFKDDESMIEYLAKQVIAKEQE